jgi:orotidine-5'-phosphate decarboxylase
MSQRWPFSELVRSRACRARLIVSLDALPPREALHLAETIGQSVGMFEVGRNLFLNSGPDFVRTLRSRGFEVFLDLRFHDAPRSLIRLATEATRLGVRMFDLRCSGNPRELEATHAAVTRICRNEGLRRPYMLAVALLSCVGPRNGNGAAAPASLKLSQLAQQSARAGLDGVITSPYQIALMRSVCKRPFIIVASGIRPHAGDNDGVDVLRAAQAMRAGADYIVAAGPIWRASDPLAAVHTLLSEMDRGLHAGLRSGPDFTTPRSV